MWTSIKINKREIIVQAFINYYIDSTISVLQKMCLILLFQVVLTLLPEEADRLPFPFHPEIGGLVCFQPVTQCRSSNLLVSLFLLFINSGGNLVKVTLKKSHESKITYMCTTHRTLACNVNFQILEEMTFHNSHLFPMITSCSSQTTWWATKQNWSMLLVRSMIRLRRYFLHCLWVHYFIEIRCCISCSDTYFVCFLIINWLLD